ncbi:hypothetical protein ACWD0J_38985, partial [Streptomyces sp. NPDC003011]
MDAGSGTPLGFGLLSAWQCRLLGMSDAPFRRRAAYAKSGRERYGTGPDLPGLLDACLAESTDRTLPETARAARACLDVCFFQPFDDGNARSAFLALAFILAGDGSTLDQTGPVRRLQRRAGDPQGTLALAGPVAALMAGTSRRAGPDTPRGMSCGAGLRSPGIISPAKAMTRKSP